MAAPLVVQLARERPWRRHLRATREGKAFIAVTLGVGVAAFNTGNNLMFLVLGFMLSLIVLSGVMSETAIRGVRVRRRLPQRAFANTTCLVELSLQNEKSRSPSYSLEVEDIAHGVATERRCYFLKVAEGAEQSAAYRRTPSRRGSLRFSGFRVATRYPFGIFEKWRLLPSDGELLVYPELLPERDAGLDPRSYGAETSTARVGPGTELAGLRGYEPLDEARLIHWRRTASLGRVVVMEREREASAQLVILLDNQRPEGAGAAHDQAFEHAVSVAATLCVTSLGRGLTVEVVARGSRSPRLEGGSAPDPILRYLALLPPTEGREPLGFGAYAKGATVVQLGASAA